MILALSRAAVIPPLSGVPVPPQRSSQLQRRPAAARDLLAATRELLAATRDLLAATRDLLAATRDLLAVPATLAVASRWPGSRVLSYQPFLLFPRCEYRIFFSSCNLLVLSGTPVLCRYSSCRESFKNYKNFLETDRYGTVSYLFPTSLEKILQQMSVFSLVLYLVTSIVLIW